MKPFFRIRIKYFFGTFVHFGIEYFKEAYVVFGRNGNNILIKSRKLFKFLIATL